MSWSWPETLAITGDHSPPSPALMSDTLFEFGFVREAVSKLGCSLSEKLPPLNFRIAP